MLASVIEVAADAQYYERRTPRLTLVVPGMCDGHHDSMNNLLLMIDFLQQDG